MQCIWLQFLATHVQRDLVAFSIYGYDVQETNDDAIPDDVAEKILRFARSAVAAGWMKNKAYAIGFYRKVRHLLRDRLMRGDGKPTGGTVFCLPKQSREKDN